VAMDQLPRLQRWFTEQSEAYQENDGAIRISTTEGPGWSLAVDLEGTALEDKDFPEIEELPDEPRTSTLLTCWVERDIWLGFCDPTQLARLLDSFLNWANSAHTARR